jgi:hypothetical protein
MMQHLALSRRAAPPAALTDTPRLVSCDNLLFNSQVYLIQAKL